MTRIPHIKDPRIQKPRGTCQECGKSIVLRGADGMLCSHIYTPTGRICEGTGKPSFKAIQKDYKIGWVPDRRSD